MPEKVEVFQVYDIDSCVVKMQDLAVAMSKSCHPHRSLLAKTNSMSIPFAMKLNLILRSADTKVGRLQIEVGSNFPGKNCMVIISEIADPSSRFYRTHKLPVAAILSGIGTILKIAEPFLRRDLFRPSCIWLPYTKGVPYTPQVGYTLVPYIF